LPVPLQDLTPLLRRLDEARARWQAAAVPAATEQAWRARAIVAAVAAAGRLEGSARGDEAVALQLAHPELTPPRTDEERLAAGHREALGVVHAEWRSLPFGVETLARLQGLLVRPLGATLALRHAHAPLVAFGPAGRAFQPVPPEDVPPHLEALVASQLADVGPHPLLTLAYTAYMLVESQPYPQGGIRLLGLVVTLLLLQAGHGYAAYAAVERALEARREALGAAVVEAQSTLAGHAAHARAWEAAFLGVLLLQAEEAEGLRRSAP
jgi:Fic family protein